MCIRDRTSAMLPMPQSEHSWWSSTRWDCWQQGKSETECFIKSPKKQPVFNLPIRAKQTGLLHNEMYVRRSFLLRCKDYSLDNYSWWNNYSKQKEGGFPHEHTHTVENPRSHQMTLDYFYGQSGELFSYFRIPKACLLYTSRIKSCVIKAPFRLRIFSAPNVLLV